MPSLQDLNQFHDTNLVTESAVAILVLELADAHLRLHSVQERRVGMYIAEAASEVALHLCVERVDAICECPSH